MNGQFILMEVRQINPNLFSLNFEKSRAFIQCGQKSFIFKNDGEKWKTNLWSFKGDKLKKVCLF